MKYKTILNISVVITAAALAWIYIAYSNLLRLIYYNAASLRYVVITLYMIMAMISITLFLWHLLGTRANRYKGGDTNGRKKRK